MMTDRQFERELRREWGDRIFIKFDSKLWRYALYERKDGLESLMFYIEDPYGNPTPLCTAVIERVKRGFAKYNVRNKGEFMRRMVEPLHEAERARRRKWEDEITEKAHEVAKPKAEWMCKNGQAWNFNPATKVRTTGHHERNRMLGRKR